VIATDGMDGLLVSPPRQTRQALDIMPVYHDIICKNEVSQGMLQ
jgi:hypothetical protein